MSFWTYYSPFGFGAVLAGVLLYSNYRAAVGTALLVAIVAGGALAFGLVLQLGFIGLQGIAARVVPVPGGRSIRGRGASWIGYSLGVAVVAAFVTGVLWIYETPPVSMGWIWTKWIFTGIGVGALASALVGYAWYWPAAARDFAND